MEKPGCYLTATAVMVIGIAGTSFAQCNRAKGQQDQMQGVRAPEPIATVGDYVIDAVTVERTASSSVGGNLGTLPPSEQGQVLATSLTNQVREAALVEVAKQHGIAVSDSEALKAVSDQIDGTIASAKIQLQMRSHSKQLPTDAELDAEIAKTGKTTAEIRKQALDDAKTALANPATRGPLIAPIAAKKLDESVAAGIKMTDDELKATYDSFEFKRILFKPAPGKSPAAEAEKVLDELKQSKDPFEKFMDRYSQDAPEPSKKLSESITTVPYSQLQQDPMSKLKVLKPGQTSEVLSLPEGATIYKLIAIKHNVPKDFDKTKETIRTSAAKAKAAEQLSATIEKAADSATIKWTSPGYHALYDWLKASQAAAKQDKGTKDKALGIVEKEAADAAGKEDPPGHKAAILAQYLCVKALYDDAADNERKAVAQRLVPAIQAVVDETSDLSIQVELVDAYLELSDGKNGVEALKQLAQNNTNLDFSGQGIWNDVNARMLKLKTAKLLSPEDEKQLQDIQAKWKSDKADQDKTAAADAKQAADEKAKADAEQKRLDAEKAKADAAAKKNAPKADAKGGASLAPSSGGSQSLAPPGLGLKTGTTGK